MRTLSSMIAEVRSQTAEVESAVNRLRIASRRMTGSTGEAPTPISKGNAGFDKVAELPPLMHQLDAELEQLNGATGNLRQELAHLESYTETRQDGETDMAVTASSKFAGSRL